MCLHPQFLFYLIFDMKDYWDYIQDFMKSSVVIHSIFSFYGRKVSQSVYVHF